jgi:hypothetical protein
MPSAHRNDGLPTDNEFGSAALHMSVSEIDEYLMAGSAPKRSLWVPDGLSARGGHQAAANAGFQPGGVPKPSHGIGPALSTRVTVEDSHYRYVCVFFSSLFSSCYCSCKGVSFLVCELKQQSKLVSTSIHVSLQTMPNNFIEKVVMNLLRLRKHH